MKNERGSVVDYRRACNIPHLSPVYNRYAARDIDRVDKSESFQPIRRTVFQIANLRQFMDPVE